MCRVDITVILLESSLTIKCRWYTSFELLEISSVSSFLPSSFHHLSLIFTPSLSHFLLEWWDFSGLNFCSNRNYVCLIHCHISKSALHIIAHQPTLEVLIHRWFARALDCQVHESPPMVVAQTEWVLDIACQTTQEYQPLLGEQLLKTEKPGASSRWAFSCISDNRRHLLFQWHGSRKK